MDELTPTHKKDNKYQNDNNYYLDLLGTPLELNKLNNTEIMQDPNEKKKYKTITHLKIANRITNNNLNQITQNLFNYQNEFLNENEYNKNEEKKNRTDVKLKNFNHIKDKKNNTEELKPKKDNILIDEENKKKQKQSDDDSENLSELAADLLSMSDGTDIKLMRQGPINKNDFIGESKEFYNINKNKDNKFKNINGNIINIEVPKLQTKIYASPLEKLKIKNMEPLNNAKNLKKNNYNIYNNLFEFKLDDPHNQNLTQTIDIRGYPSNMKNHIYSNSSINKINNKQFNNNNSIINKLVMHSQMFNKKNYINNNDNFNKTTLNQYTNDLMAFKEENDRIKRNLNNTHSIGKKNIYLNNFGKNIKINNSKSHRNKTKNSFVKQINSFSI